MSQETGLTPQFSRLLPSQSDIDVIMSDLNHSGSSSSRRPQDDDSTGVYFQFQDSDVADLEPTSSSHRAATPSSHKGKRKLCFSTDDLPLSNRDDEENSVVALDENWQIPPYFTQTRQIKTKKSSEVQEKVFIIAHAEPIAPNKYKIESIGELHVVKSIAADSQEIISYQPPSAALTKILVTEFIPSLVKEIIANDGRRPFTLTMVKYAHQSDVTRSYILLAISGEFLLADNQMSIIRKFLPKGQAVHDTSEINKIFETYRKKLKTKLTELNENDGEDDDTRDRRNKLKNKLDNLDKNQKKYPGILMKLSNINQAISELNKQYPMYHFEFVFSTSKLTQDLLKMGNPENKAFWGCAEVRTESAYLKAKYQAGIKNDPLVDVSRYQFSISKVQANFKGSIASCSDRKKADDLGRQPFWNSAAPVKKSGQPGISRFFYYIRGIDGCSRCQGKAGEGAFQALRESIEKTGPSPNRNTFRTPQGKLG